MNTETFASPPVEFRPVPFWSWNEAIDLKNLEWHAKAIHDAGWGGAFVHSRIGLLTPYMGKEWMDCVRKSIECFEREGLHLWLYDEDKWPSGFSGGSVPKTNPSHRMKVLVGRPVGHELPGGQPYGEPRQGIQVWLWQSPMGQKWFNGTCYVDTGDPQAVRAFIEAGYAPYHEHFGEHYGKTIPAEFTDEVCLLFRIHVPYGAVPFSNALEGMFERMHGYKLRDSVALLFIDDPLSARFRLHYFRATNKCFEENFSRQVGEWCGERGIVLTGHYMHENGVYNQLNWGVKIMPNYRHQGIPGIDHLGRKITERLTAKQCQSVVNQYAKPRMLTELYGVAGDGLTFADRRWIALQQICLGANVLNNHLALYSMVGCRKRDYPQNMFYQQPWFQENKVVEEPLSRLCYALSQGRYDTNLLILHPCESGFALWQPLTTAPPEEPLTNFADREFHSIAESARESIRRIDDQLSALVDRLLGLQHTFDLGDETILSEDGMVVETSEGPLLRVGAMAYRCVVLPSMETISRPVFDLLLSFHGKGGKIVLCGTPPRLLEGMPDPVFFNWLSQIDEVEIKDLGDALKSICPPLLELKVESGNRDLCWLHNRDLGDGRRLVLVVNLDRKLPLKGKAILSKQWSRARHWDDGTGVVSELHLIPCGKDSLQMLNLEIPPAQCKLIELSHVSPPEFEKQYSESIRIDQSDNLPGLILHKVEPLEDNALPLDMVYWREAEGDWSKYPVPLVALQERLVKLEYRGRLNLRYCFEMDAALHEKSLRLVVERHKQCEIKVNGKPLRYSGMPFWKNIGWLPIDMEGCLRPGLNCIELCYPEFRYGNLRETEDQVARYGTELEAVYVVGDFVVQGRIASGSRQPEWSDWGLPEVKSHRLYAEGIRLSSMRAIDGSDWAKEGYPFYAGAMRYFYQVNLSQDPSPDWVLELTDCAAIVVRIEINGQFAGHVYAEPYQLPIGAYLHAGENFIELTVYSSLRNLLGPHHHPEGELAWVSPRQFASRDLETDANPAQRVFKWGASGDGPKDWNPNYSVLRYGIGGVRLK